MSSLIKHACIVGLGLSLFGCSMFSKKESELEFRYAKIEKGTLVRSISATGQVVALTVVDVKSKAGGKVVKLAVDEGAIVKKGDLVAIIDPVDTQAIYDQANADVSSSNARVTQAINTLKLQRQQAKIDIENAQASLDAAKERLKRSMIEVNRQPLLTSNGLNQAQAAYEAALATLQKYENVTAPQTRREAASTLTSARVARETAENELQRQQDLLAKGYVAGSTVDRARSAAETAKTNYEIAQQRASTVEADIKTTLRAETQNVEKARLALDEAKVNRVQDDVVRSNYQEALRNVRIAETNLEKARSNALQNEIKASDINVASASKMRNIVTLKNAQSQLESTTVLAPRDGVVTLKYLEEGTIIPPGTSTFSQGTSLVQISDVTQLYVECAVDEADVSNVAVGQRVKITADAYRGQSFPGVVTRVNPAAVTANNITAIKVRVKVLPGANVRVVPGMNATCEFLTLEKKDVLIAPSQAVKTDNGATTVKVKSADPKKPEVRKIEIGEQGNDGVEIKSGLKEGEEVVTAEIDLAAMRETQKKMQEVQQGGGLASGGQGGGPNSRRTPASGGRAGGSGGGGGRGR